VPRGKRTESISERDLEVLAFIARHGVVPRNAVAAWADTRRTVTQTRERRLRPAGLLEVIPAFGGLGPFAVATRIGLRACGLGELRLARFSYAEAGHTATAALLAASLEHSGHAILSEREVAARERSLGERVYSAKLPGGRFHSPDLVLLSDRPEAIEVELTPKGATRLDAILRAWRRAVAERRLARVSYHCAPATLRLLRRAIERTEASAHVRSLPLATTPGSAGDRAPQSLPTGA
jgi:hypothetical protein